MRKLLIFAFLLVLPLFAEEELSDDYIEISWDEEEYKDKSATGISKKYEFFEGKRIKTSSQRDGDFEETSLKSPHTDITVYTSFAAGHLGTAGFGLDVAHMRYTDDILSLGFTVGTRLRTFSTDIFPVFVKEDEASNTLPSLLQYASTTNVEYSTNYSVVRLTIPIMFNMYFDIDLGLPITPYVTAGIGMQTTLAMIDFVPVFNRTITYMGPMGSVGAGIVYFISDKTRAFVTIGCKIAPVLWGLGNSEALAAERINDTAFYISIGLGL